ncbi:MAG: glycosyltransferase [Bacteroidales bacterium]|nr:glycosyltransferase [Bacteroidales bacterium]
MITEIGFWILFGLIIYSYILYPSAISFATFISGRKNNNPDNIVDYPFVTVLMPVYNEEIVIEEKVRVLTELDYPEHKIDILIGSDASTDKTNIILKKLEKEINNLKCKFFKTRKGKASVLNNLSHDAVGEIIVITDANVFPEQGSLKAIVKNFKDQKTGLVDSRLLGKGEKKYGVSLAERTYLNLESHLRYNESALMGCMMGPSGGFYALRKKLLVEIPENYLVDDFFICMSVLQKGYKAIFEKSAVVTETITDDLLQEYRRKVRISTGNFQNLVHFAGIFLSPWKKIFFCYFSHKVIRWFVPLLYIGMFTLNWLLTGDSKLYTVLFYVQLIFLLLPALDFLLKSLKIHLIPFRFVTHFYIMNIALLEGFLRFFKGVKSGIWEPTKRII